MSVGWISPFLEAQAAELNAAENTLLAYGRDLKDAAGWLSARGTDFAAARRADLEAYLIALEADGHGPRHPRAAALVAETALPLRLRGRLARRQSRASDHRAGPRTKPAENPFDGRG